eukprot:CAMPEP_0180813208 /NCGR_PEP_ID=MMETSP1038_2-20121128/66415_1 /TAXON_ID=632150 /ORGANISM="Azadinium spinosum, Strain 3D9" /LENGTH=54 /DNA_ID=CAMNT_0022854789 /DNA_START=474 /DNA_END=635 /DNA_ORIENTATION=-
MSIAWKTCEFGHLTSVGPEDENAIEFNKHQSRHCRPMPARRCWLYKQSSSSALL